MVTPSGPFPAVSPAAAPLAASENAYYVDYARLTYKNGSNVLGTLSHAYDNAGNRAQVGGTWARTGLPQAVASATYNAANHQLTFGSQSLTYDLNGNLTNDGSTTYTWDSRNRLASLSGPGTAASFQYDPVGRRSRKVVNGTTTDLLYDGANPIQELSGGSPVANLLTGLGIDEYFTRTDSAGTRALLTDALGSTLALTDPTGAVQPQYTYEPFGNTTTTGPTSANPLQYTGRENDGTGLYYYRNRYYSATALRFISEDNVNRNGGGNLYAYVRNNPLRWIDPFGLWTYAKEYGTTGEYLTQDIKRIENVVDRVFNTIASRDAIVTYTTNGAHKEDSLHYDGDAIDLRTRDLSSSERSRAADNLRRELGSDYRVIDEGTHIHIEYRGTGPGGGGSGGAGENGGGGPGGGGAGSGTSSGMGSRK